MSRLFIPLFLVLMVACSGLARKNAVLLDYSDFGPQVIASEIVGMEWWQWQLHGDSRPVNYDVKIVIYRGRSLNEIKNIYSVEPENKLDFRYLEYQQALTFLDDKIEENAFEGVTSTLEESRKKIVRTLGW